MSFFCKNFEGQNSFQDVTKVKFRFQQIRITKERRKEKEEGKSGKNEATLGPYEKRYWAEKVA